MLELGLRELRVLVEQPFDLGRRARARSRGEVRAILGPCRGRPPPITSSRSARPSTSRVRPSSGPYSASALARHFAVLELPGSASASSFEPLL